MTSPDEKYESVPKLPRAAVPYGLVAGFVTAGAVSWSTPDGNLVVTTVPALVVGLAVFAFISWRCRPREPQCPIAD